MATRSACSSTVLRCQATVMFFTHGTVSSELIGAVCVWASARTA